MALPRCRACPNGVLVPLSDYADGGADVRFKAWVCVNPACGFNLKIRKGDVLLGEPVHDLDSRLSGRAGGASAP